MNPSVTAALEAQRLAADSWASEQGADRALQFYLGLVHMAPDQLTPEQTRDLAHDPEVQADLLSICRASMDQLREARLYVIADHIAEGLTLAQASMPPDVPFGVSMLPTANGFAFLEGAHLRVPHPRFPNGDVVRALGWAIAPLLRPEDALHVRVQVWVDRGGWPPTWRQNMLVPDGYLWNKAMDGFEFAGDSREVARSSVESRTTSGTIMRYLLALGAFVTERLLVDDVVRPDRSERRRMQRELGSAYIEPQAHVLHMRELEHTRAERRGLGPVDWSCSWVVSSHWRRQYHPSTGDHRLKLIRPYVKGDRTKPLRGAARAVRVIDR